MIDNVEIVDVGYTAGIAFPVNQILEEIDFPDGLSGRVVLARSVSCSDGEAVSLRFLFDTRNTVEVTKMFTDSFVIYIGFLGDMIKKVECGKKHIVEVIEQEFRAIVSDPWFGF